MMVLTVGLTGPVGMISDMRYRLGLLGEGTAVSMNCCFPTPSPLRQMLCKWTWFDCFIPKHMSAAAAFSCSVPESPNTFKWFTMNATKLKQTCAFVGLSGKKRFL